jgi:hypothetical protein
MMYYMYICRCLPVKSCKPVTLAPEAMVDPLAETEVEIVDFFKYLGMFSGS